MSVNEQNLDFSRNKDTFLTREMNLRISQEMNSLINVNSQIESAISTATYERILPMMQNVVESTLARQLRNVPGLSRRPHISVQRVTLNEDIVTDRNFRSHRNLLEPEEDCPHMVTGAFELQTSVPEFSTGLHTTTSQPTNRS